MWKAVVCSKHFHRVIWSLRFNISRHSHLNLDMLLIHPLPPMEHGSNLSTLPERCNYAILAQSKIWNDGTLFHYVISKLICNLRRHAFSGNWGSAISINLLSKSAFKKKCITPFLNYNTANIYAPILFMKIGHLLFC